MVGFGRKTIWTDEEFVTRENIIDVLISAVSDHAENAADCKRLIAFEAGDQPFDRIKKFRSDIDNKVVDNVAAEVVDFKLGFIWGNPITFVQRESTTEDNEKLSEAIMALNDCYIMAGNGADTQKLARFIEICGLGYTYIDINTEWEDGDSYFTRDVLDPCNTFVVRSRAYQDHRVVLGGSFRETKDKTKYYTCFTNTERFEVENFEIKNGEFAERRDEKGRGWRHSYRSGETNPLGRIPIIEWIRSYDRMGCFEKQISEMVNLNLLISDMTNDVDQNTQAIWWSNDVDFPKEIIKDEDGNEIERTKKPGAGEWVRTYTPEDGRSPSIQPLTLDYDMEGMLNNVLSRRALILQKCHVPQRSDNSGGSTGLAMDAASGWTDAESFASAQELITVGCQMQEIRVVLAAIRENPDVESDNVLLILKPRDVEPTVRRPKNFELTVKVNAAATLLNQGFALEDVVSTIPIFPDNSQVIMRSGEMVRKFQEKNISEEKVEEDIEVGDTTQDSVSQISNSPFVDGMSTMNAEV